MMSFFSLHILGTLDFMLPGELWISLFMNSKVLFETGKVERRKRLRRYYMLSVRSQIIGEGLSVLLYCLLHQQLVLHGSGRGSHKSSSLRYLLKIIQKSTWGNSRGFPLRELQVATDGSLVAVKRLKEETHSGLKMSPLYPFKKVHGKDA